MDGRLPPLLSGALFAACFYSLVLALGRRASIWFRLPFGELTTVERGFAYVTIGTGLIQLVPYTLGMLGILSTSSVRFGLGLVALLVARDLLALGRAFVRRVRSRDAFPRPSKATLAWALPFVVLMGILALRALSVGPSGDDDGYHLSAARRWLREGSLSYLPTYTNTNSAMGFETLYVIGLSTVGPGGLKLCHYFAGVLTFLGIWLSARRLRCGTAGIVSVSLLLIPTPLVNVPSLLGLAYVDLGASWMTLASVFFFLCWSELGRPSFLACVGLCAGIAASFKSTALSVGVAWQVVLLLEGWRAKRPWKEILGTAVGVGLLNVAPILPWFARSWRVTGNPVFPMFAGVFHTRDWSPELADIFGKFLHYYAWGVGAGTRLGELQRKEIVAATALAAIVSSGVLIAIVKDRTLRWITLFGAIVAVVSIAMAGMVFRYWLPGLICILLVITVWIGRRWADTAWFSSAPAALTIAALGMQLWRPAWGSLKGDFQIAIGAATLDEAYAADPSWQMWRYIATNTPKDARILVSSFYTSFGASSFGCFWIDRTCLVTDSHMQIVIGLHDWQEFLSGVEKAGTTYVLIGDEELLRGRHGYVFPAAQNEYAFGRRLVDEQGEKLSQFGHFQFYRLRLPLAGR